MSEKAAKRPLESLEIIKSKTKIVIKTTLKDNAWKQNIKK